ncbi:MAG: tRNA epoxyqueuosine(34) reductase QueG [Gammaproteobacteria bacterium]|nr:MAG: tRNA epoxyqueuosine(34) reductase QueG [Gammaproteobacteria bacterium]
MPNHPCEEVDYLELTQQIKQWGNELGFQQVGVTDTQLNEAEKHLNDWLDKGHHGGMNFMQKHGSSRTHPAELVPGTIRVISLRMDYLPELQQVAKEALKEPINAFISRYALGRDYHKLIRKRLQKLAIKIEQSAHSHGYRVFTDSAPIMEKALAEKAGLGWIGKHSNLINKKSGSWFFLGEIYTDLPLPVDTAATHHCGDCIDCIHYCPTQAIIAPFQVDARRCISYLTIELKGAIPEALRKPMGNRIYGCDDCQQACPWNRFAQLTTETDFLPRQGLDSASLVELFSWDEEAFLKKTEGSAIRRIGHLSWLRNIAVGLGNAQQSEALMAALNNRKEHPSELVREHVEWALSQHTKRPLPDK